MPGHRARAASALLAAVLAAGCASEPAGGGGRVVFSVVGGFTTRLPVHTREIVDRGLFPLHNTTSFPVRVTSVQFAGASSKIHIVNVRAYNARQTRGFIVGMAGDLAKECPRYFHPHPVSSFITPPHAATLWFIVIAFTAAAPGRYKLPKVKIFYITNGHRGWQYQDLNTTLIVKNPPLPGPRPITQRQVCG